MRYFNVLVRTMHWSWAIKCQTVNLVQIATATDVYVIRTAFGTQQMDRFQDSEDIATRIKRSLQWLHPLMEAEWIKKCGVGVHGDAALLQKWDETMPIR
jgi:hypothetical protein